MNERTLLEAAARSIGLYEKWPAPYCEVQWTENGLWCSGEGEGVLWNPYRDDGDALRLAVQLNLHIMRFDNMTTVRPMGADWCCDERDDGDSNSATRRAIVRAAGHVAAQFGKQMP